MIKEKAHSIQAKIETIIILKILY